MINTIQVEAIYENGTLRLQNEIPVREHERVLIYIVPLESIVNRGYGLLRWKGILKFFGALLRTTNPRAMNLTFDRITRFAPI